MQAIIRTCQLYSVQKISPWGVSEHSSNLKMLLKQGTPMVGEHLLPSFLEDRWSKNWKIPSDQRRKDLGQNSQSQWRYSWQKTRNKYHKNSSRCVSSFKNIWKSRQNWIEDMKPGQRWTTKATPLWVSNDTPKEGRENTAKQLTEVKEMEDENVWPSCL